MNHLIGKRIVRTGILAIALLALATDSFAALNAYLKLKRSSDGKTYKCKLDESGKFSFSNVEPGTYDLLFEVTATDKAGNTGSDSKTQPTSIEISSFSWGATNMGTSRNEPATKSSSNIQNNSVVSTGGGPDITGTPVSAVTTSGGVRVATGDVDGDGRADMISSPVTCTITPNDGTSADGKYHKVVLKDVMVSSMCSPSGACKGNWNLKENVK